MSTQRDPLDTYAHILVQLFGQAEQRTAQTQSNLQQFTEALAKPVEGDKEEVA